MTKGEDFDCGAVLYSSRQLASLTQAHRVLRVFLAQINALRRVAAAASMSEHPDERSRDGLKSPQALKPPKPRPRPPSGHRHAPTALGLNHLAPNFFGTMPMDSPLFLPVVPVHPVDLTCCGRAEDECLNDSRCFCSQVEPSPTTGIQHLIPPLFQHTATRHAMGVQAGSSGKASADPGPASPLPSPVSKFGGLSF